MVFQSYTLFPWLQRPRERRVRPEAAECAGGRRERIVDHFLTEIGLAAFAEALSESSSPAA